MKRDSFAHAHAILCVGFLTACGGSLDLRVGDRPDAAEDGGADATHAAGNPNADGGHDSSVSDVGHDDAAVKPPSDSGPDAAIKSDGGPDASASTCFDNCNVMYPSSASDAQLTLSDCCSGACASVCPLGTCFGMSGIFGQPDASSICQSCAVGPLKSGTCGEAPSSPPSEFDAYQSCLKACQ